MIICKEKNTIKKVHPILSKQSLLKLAKHTEKEYFGYNGPKNRLVAQMEIYLRDCCPLNQPFGEDAIWYKKNEKS